MSKVRGLNRIDELAPGKRKTRITKGSMVKFTEQQRKEAVLSLCTRDTSAEKVAEEHGVSRTILYKWRQQLIGEKSGKIMSKRRKADLPDDKDKLVAELESLKKQVYNLQLEIDILNGTAELLKKDAGIDHQRLSNKEKTMLVDALRTMYPLNELLAAVDLAKSSYFYHKNALSQPDKYSSLRTRIKDIFHKNRCCYGYRRIHASLKNQGITCSEKIVRRIMEEEHLIVQGKKKRKYSSYQGEITPAVENLIARDFHAEKPNEKWLTDLTEFHIPAGKVYLSPIIDCFDGMVISWTIGTSPDAELVNTMLDSAIACLQSGEHPIMHSDRGCHYRWSGWILRMETARLVRSMSKKGYSPDNAACEGFFGIVKNEMFYSRSWDGVSVEESIDELNSFLHWYNDERIKLSLGAMSPMAYRQSLGLIA